MDSRTYTGQSVAGGASGSTAAGGAPEAVTSSSITELTGEVIDGLLDVGPILGKGGMGVVYQVFHREWNRELAMKIPIHLGGEKFDLRRWVREAHTWIDLGLHPRVVSCWFVRQWREVPALFLDLYAGGSLKEKLEAREHPPQSPLEWAEAFTWLIHASEGLHHAHQMGLIHRDIKPANLMFDADGNLAVTDFGLGKAFNQPESPDSAGQGGIASPSEILGAIPEPSLTRTGVMTGTPHYAPPEQWMQRPVGPQADIYAFAVVAYQVLTGRHPFEPPGERWDLGRLITAHLMGEVFPPAKHNPDIPSRLSEILAQSLAKAASDRPSSLLEVRDVLLEAYLERAGEVYTQPLPAPLSQRADALNNKAVSLWSIGMRKEALTAWGQAEGLERDHLEVSYNRAITSWLTGRRRPLEIEGVLRGIGASSSRGSCVWGQYLLARGEFVEAARSLSEGLASLGLREDGTLWRALGDAALGAGDRDQALEAYSKALELIPSDNTTRITCARLSAGKPMVREGFVSQANLESLGRLLCWASLELAEGLVLVYAASLVVVDLTGHELTRAPLPSMNVITRVEVRAGKILVLGSHEAYLLLLEHNDGRWSWGQARHVPQHIQGFIDEDRILMGLTTLQIRSWVDLSQHGTLMVGHEKQVFVHRYLPKQQRLITGGGDRVVRFWNLADAQCLAEGRGHGDFITKLNLARQDQLLITGDGSGMVAFWLLPKLERLQKLEFRGQIIDLEVAGDGQQEVLLVGYQSGEGFRRTAAVLLDRMQVIFDEPGGVALWNSGFALWEGREVAVLSLPECIEWRHQVVADSPILWCLSYADGQELLLWLEGNELLRWRLPSGIPIPPPLPLVRANTLWEAQQARQSFLSMMEKARQSFEAKEWETSYSDLCQARKVEGYAREQEALDLLSDLTQRLPRKEVRELYRACELVSPGRDRAQRFTVGDEGQWVATSSGSLIRLWDLRRGTCVRGMTGHREEVIGLSFWRADVPFGQPPLLFSFSADRSVRLWDCRTGECLQTLVAGVGSAIVTVGFCTETRFYAFVDRGGRLCTGRWSRSRPFELESLAVFRSLELPEAVTVGPSGGWLVVAEGRSKVFQLDTPESVPRLELELPYILTLLPWPDGRLLGTTSTGSLEVYDLERRTVIQSFPRRGRAIVALAATKDGEVLATVDDNGLIELWLLGLAHKVLERTVEEPIRSLTFSGDGRYLLALSRAGTLMIWELEWGLGSVVLSTTGEGEQGLAKKSLWSRLRRTFGGKA